MSSRHIPANPRRMADGAIETAQRNSRACGGSSASPLAGPVFVDRSKVTDCGTCGKSAAKLEQLQRGGFWECSHIECPKRKRPTAQEAQR